SILLMAGDGELFEEIKYKAEVYGLKDKCMFLGIREDVPELLQAMDIFVFPSLFEGLGIVLVEAQANGLPCVVSDEIPEEAFLTDEITKISLKSNAKYWAEQIMRYETLKKTRISNVTQLKTAGYDVQDVAGYLYKLYINKYPGEKYMMKKDYYMTVIENARNNVLKIAKKEHSKLDTEYKDRQIIIYGKGSSAQWLYSFLSELGYGGRVVAFCDDFIKEETKICNLPVLPYDKIIKKWTNIIFYVYGHFKNEILERLYKRNEKRILKFSTGIMDTGLFRQIMQPFTEEDEKEITLPCHNILYFMKICSELYYQDEVAEKLKKVKEMLDDKRSVEVFDKRLEFLGGNIEALYSMMACEKGYYSEDYYHITDSEIFVDCGAYNGDSLTKLINYAGGIKKAFCFEPDYSNYLKLNKCVSEIECGKIITYLAATGETNKTERFESRGTVSSLLGAGDDIVHIERLDDLLSGEKITFMKLDVEGSELATLKGAENIIKNNVPKLAVCLYHKPEDLYEIPLYLKSLVPEYKIKIRHHTYNIYDTVLYASV
ncbi:MAG: FkbM family methyltransferase, partial [Lachnospiraceae bacterium]|nr:FkbM family methyltransferase [Lachnospiraceae bacterium]